MISTGAVSSVLPVSDGVLFSATGGFSPEDVGFSSPPTRAEKIRRTTMTAMIHFALPPCFLPHCGHTDAFWGISL